MPRFPNRPNDFDIYCSVQGVPMEPPSFILWYPRFKRTTPTLSEFGGKSLNGYNTKRGAFWKDMLMPETRPHRLEAKDISLSRR